MHIQEIVIDGFKSYATRTVVSGFDASFNAITGARRNCARESRATARAPTAARRRPLLTPPPPHAAALRAGLNGSGKSNVLDAICFVLGITNLSQVRPRLGARRRVPRPRCRRRQTCRPSLSLSGAPLAPLQVRAASLSDLVYKAGQGGVTKATVSIVFDNRDARVSPPGYEHCEARWPFA